MINFLTDYLPIILTVAGVLGAGGIILLLGFWPIVSSFLIGTRTGRFISAAAAGALIVFFAFVAGKRKGAQAQRAKQLATNLKVAQKRVKINVKIRNRTPADRRKLLTQWVRG